MQRPPLALVFLAALAASLSGCRSRAEYGHVQYGGGPRYASATQYGGPQRPGPQYVGPRGAPASGSSWFPVQQPRAGFSCRMPAIPRVETSSGYDDDGAAYQSVRVRADSPYGIFGMFVTQWEGGVVGDPLVIARELAESILEHTDTPDRRATRVAIPGFYAREDIGHATNGTFFALRQFFGRDRIYVAVASVRSDPMGLRAAEEFMRSVALDRRDALLPFGESTQPVPLYLPDVDFAVHMPPLASRRSSSIEVDGAPVDASMFESRHASGVYRVTVVSFPDRVPEQALEHVAVTLSLGTADRYIDASGYPGRTFQPTGDRAARAFATPNRVYVLEIIGASGLGQAARDDFFGSFRIL